MKYSKSIKPISYLKAHASELVREINENNETMIITLNGEAKVVVQDIKVYEQMEDSLALLKILAQSSKSIAEGRSKTLDEAFLHIRQQTAKSEL
jgi:prevent-host-death family protein